MLLLESYAFIWYRLDVNFEKTNHNLLDRSTSLLGIVFNINSSETYSWLSVAVATWLNYKMYAIVTLLQHMYDIYMYFLYCHCIWMNLAVKSPCNAYQTCIWHLWVRWWEGKVCYWKTSSHLLKKLKPLQSKPYKRN